MSGNQRRRITMDRQEIETLCRSRRTAILCSHLPDGNIHAVPMWFLVEGADLVFSTKGKSQKVQNLRRDSRATVLIESGETYFALRGVEMIGHVELVEDPSEVLRYVTLVAESYGGATSNLSSAERARNRVLIRFSPERVASWDHAKLERD